MSVFGYPRAGLGDAELGDADDARRASRPVSAAVEHARLRAMIGAHFDFVWRAVRGLGVPAADADDAAQQVFLVASRKLSSIALGSERAFLFAAARGIAANARRARMRRREDVDSDALARELDDRPDPEQAVARNEGRRVIERVLDSMPEELREVFVLYELEGETAAAIADLLAIPPGTVASRLRRAREIFERAAEGVVR